jgi:uncharacterized repeat protein (TIGR01451 family)
VHYTVTVQNTGTAIARQVYFDDFIQPGMSIAALTGECVTGTYNNGQLVVRCLIGDLQPGQSRSLPIVLNVLLNHACNNGAMATNSATAWAANASYVYTPIINTPVICPITSSSSSSSFSSFGNTQLTIQKMVQESQVSPGGTVHYTITVQNVGSMVANNVYFDDDIHSNQMSVITSLPNGCNRISDSIIRCQIGSLNPGASSSIQLTFQAPGNNYQCTMSSILNTASLYASNLSTVPTSTVSTPFICFNSSSSYSSYGNNTGLELRKEASASEVFPGGTIEYTLRISNHTNHTVNGIVVSDNLPQDTDVSDAGNANNNSSRNLQWNIGSLSINQTVVLTYRVHVSNGARYGEILVNNARAQGNSGENAYDSVSVSVIGELPQTGFSALGGGTSFLSPINPLGAGSSAGLPFAGFLSLAATGLSGGLFIGKKFLFI